MICNLQYPQSGRYRRNRAKYIVRLAGKAITVSVETVKLVEELVQAVQVDDWMSVAMSEN